jgi:hypothetical protein
MFVTTGTPPSNASALDATKQVVEHVSPDVLAGKSPRNARARPW